MASFCFVFFVIVSQVFKDLDFLGWYTTGDSATETDLRVHEQVHTVQYMIFKN